MPLVVATLRELKPPLIGIDIVRASASTSFGKPWPSVPRRIAARGFRLARDSGSRPAELSARMSKFARRGARRFGRRFETGERHDEACADRNPNRLPVERIACLRVEEHGVGAEGGGVAEDAADIVVVGKADQPDDEGAIRQSFDELSCRKRRAALPDRQYAAMDRKTDDGIHDGAARAVDGNRLGQRRQDLVEAFDAIVRDQDRLDGKARAGKNRRSTTSPSTTKRSPRPARSRSRTKR